MIPYCLAGTKTLEELSSGIVIVHEEKLVMGETNNELERIFNSYRYQVKNMLSIVSSIYIV